MAVVAVATAWSGYQSTRWGGEQADQYVQASAARVRSASHSTEAGQHTLYDAVMFNNWLNAYDNNEPDLAAK